MKLCSRLFNQTNMETEKIANNQKKNYHVMYAISAQYDHTMPIISTEPRHCSYDNKLICPLKCVQNGSMPS